MKASPIQLFQRRLARLEHTRARLERVFSDRRVLLTDVEAVYESLFLKATTGFENYLEDLFCGILHGRIQYRGSRVTPLVGIKSTQTLHRVLWGGDDYLDWMPYTRTIARAEAWLRAGRPFTDLDDGKRAKLKTMHVIRNAIAHSSDHVHEQFRRVVIGSQHLRVRERSPAGYLRSIYISTPRITRFEQLAGDLNEIATILSP